MMIVLNTKQWVKNDKNIRKLFLKYEIKKIIIKSLLYNYNNTIYQKLYFDKKYKQFTFKSSIARARTSCIFLGNNKSIFNNFKMSRDMFKKYASEGYIIGLRKSSF